MHHAYSHISTLSFSRRIRRLLKRFFIPLPFNLLRNKEQGTCSLQLAIKFYRLIHWCFRAEVNIIPDSLFHTIPFKELTPGLVRWRGKPAFWGGRDEPI